MRKRTASMVASATAPGVLSAKACAVSWVGLSIGGWATIAAFVYLIRRLVF